MSWFKHLIQNKKHRETTIYFPKENCRKSRPTWTRIKQNSDHTRIIQTKFIDTVKMCKQVKNTCIKIRIHADKV